MLSLNQDILVEIAGNLEIDEIFACMRVCQSFLKCYDSDKVFIVLLAVCAVMQCIFEGNVLRKE
jgi:hypothetical protein